MTPKIIVSVLSYLKDLLLLSFIGVVSISIPHVAHIRVEYVYNKHNNINGNNAEKHAVENFYPLI